MDTTVLTLIAAAGPLCGALGAQALAAHFALRTRRLEIYWQAKGDAYKGLLERLAEFASHPTDEKVYFDFLTAYETALLFASDEVAEQLAGTFGISVNAQRLRAAPTADKRLVVASVSWYDATKAASAAMRKDLKRLSGGLQ
jgi:hypothetical protein